MAAAERIGVLRQILIAPVTSNALSSAQAQLFPSLLVRQAEVAHVVHPVIRDQNKGTGVYGR
jgi:hypothetical protein